ncbi:hypothetical protein JCM19000A_25450 [Silvimonas sp. JCM 19000]
MSFREQVYQALAPLVGARCYPELLPENLADYPAIYWSYMATPDATVGGEADEESIRLEINVVARTTDALASLRVAVSDAMYDTFDTAQRISDMPMPYDDSGGLFRRVIEFNLRA